MLPVSCPAAPDAPAPVISVPGGQIRGGIFGDIANYRGIPFAAPPVGDLRWRAPQPVKAWTGVRDAAQSGPSCAASEDCLTINVQKPANMRPGEKLPVMVWIYGGSFTGGSAGQYDGAHFARRGVVYVAINYRLGRTGWFAHPAITKNAPAGEAFSNYGLMDQIAGLRWVKANIGKFGGDVNNITAFGESAGGISVNYLMILPEARGLFGKAITQSAFGRRDPYALSDFEGRGKAYFDAKGITGDSAATLARMRQVPFADLAQPPVGAGGAGVIRDGRLVTIGTAQAFAEGKQMKIPYLTGGNSNEASLFQTPRVEDRLTAIRATTRDLGPYSAAGRNEPQRVLNLLVTDQYITEPDRNLVRAHAKTGQPTYRYHISYTSPGNGRAPTSFGLAHGGELGYVFARSQNPEDVAISQAIVAYWTAFAKYGTPGAAGGVAWPKHDAAKEPVMEFALTGPRVVEKIFDERLNWMERNYATVLGSAAAGGATR